MTPAPFVFMYRNHRGATYARKVEPIRVWYGSTQWRPEPQWFLAARDLDKDATRDFAMKDMLGGTAYPEGPKS